MNKLVLIDFDHTLFDTDRFKAEAFTDFDHLPETDLNQYLFPDALPFINYLSPHFTPAIFSEGPQPFQHQKIVHTQVINLISEKLIFDYSSSQKNSGLNILLKSYSIAVLIDDKPEFIDHAINLGLPTVRVARGKYAHQSSHSSPTHTVTSLQQIIDQDLLSKLNS